jgi:hypothetical protein
MTSNVHNQGIAHLAFRAGGVPFCRSRRAHLSVTIENAAGWTICKRCAAKLAKMQTNKQETEKCSSFAR